MFHIIIPCTIRTIIVSVCRCSMISESNVQCFPIGNWLVFISDNSESTWDVWKTIRWIISTNLMHGSWYNQLPLENVLTLQSFCKVLHFSFQFDFDFHAGTITTYLQLFLNNCCFRAYFRCHSESLMDSVIDKNIHRPSITPD